MAPYRTFIKSYRWQRMRRFHLDRNPLCAMCREQGRVTLADTVHHRFPCSDNIILQANPDNLQSLCQDCHQTVHGARPQPDRVRKKKRQIGEDGYPL
jgi:5-methylcytosine-specific restriction protein A